MNSQATLFTGLLTGIFIFQIKNKLHVIKRKKPRENAAHQ